MLRRHIFSSGSAQSGGSTRSAQSPMSATAPSSSQTARGESSFEALVEELLQAQPELTRTPSGRSLTAGITRVTSQVSFVSPGGVGSSASVARPRSAVLPRPPSVLAASSASVSHDPVLTGLQILQYPRLTLREPSPPDRARAAAAAPLATDAASLAARASSGGLGGPPSAASAPADAMAAPAAAAEEEEEKEKAVGTATTAAVSVPVASQRRKHSRSRSPRRRPSSARPATHRGSASDGGPIPFAPPAPLVPSVTAALGALALGGTAARVRPASARTMLHGGGSRSGGGGAGGVSRPRPTPYPLSYLHKMDSASLSRSAAGSGGAATAGSAKGPPPAPPVAVPVTPLPAAVQPLAGDAPALSPQQQSRARRRALRHELARARSNPRSVIRRSLRRLHSPPRPLQPPPYRYSSLEDIQHSLQEFERQQEAERREREAALARAAETMAAEQEARRRAQPPPPVGTVLLSGAERLRIARLPGGRIRLERDDLPAGGEVSARTVSVHGDDSGGGGGGGDGGVDDGDVESSHSAAPADATPAPPPPEVDRAQAIAADALQSTAGRSLPTPEFYRQPRPRRKALPPRAG